LGGGGVNDPTSECDLTGQKRVGNAGVSSARISEYRSITKKARVTSQKITASVVWSALYNS